MRALRSSGQIARIAAPPSPPITSSRTWSSALLPRPARWLPRPRAPRALRLRCSAVPPAPPTANLEGPGATMLRSHVPVSPVVLFRGAFRPRYPLSIPPLPFPVLICRPPGRLPPLSSLPCPSPAGTIPLQPSPSRRRTPQPHPPHRPLPFVPFLLSPFPALYVCPSVRLSLRPSVPPSVCPSVRLSSVRLSLRPSVPPSVCPSVRLSLRPSVPPSVCPSVRLSLRPSVPPSVCPFVSLSLRQSVPPSVA